MKKLSKINLHNLSQVELAKREEKLLKGGSSCECNAACGGRNCGCLYAGEQTDNKDSYYGGSSSNANFVANQLQSFDANIGTVVNSVMQS